MEILKEVLVEQIKSNPFQPRKHFDEETIKELAESIKKNKMIQPVVVREIEDGYELQSGERRFRAVKVLGWKEVPVIVREIGNGDMIVGALVENVQREDLNYVEKADSLRELAEREDIVHKIPHKPELKGQINISGLAERTGLSANYIGDIFDAANLVEATGTVASNLSQNVINETRGLVIEERVKLLTKAAEDELGGRKIRKTVSVVKKTKVDEPIREALLTEEKITAEVGEQIIEANLDVKQQEHAIKNIVKEIATPKQAIIDALYSDEMVRVEKEQKGIDELVGDAKEKVDSLMSVLDELLKRRHEFDSEACRNSFEKFGLIVSVEELAIKLNLLLGGKKNDKGKPKSLHK